MLNDEIAPTESRIISDESPLTELADGLWTATAPVRILGMPLTSTMTVVRLSDGSLLVHSPVALADSLRAAIEALGSVEHLYAPNTFHHMQIGAWKTAFPKARLHAPTGLVKKRQDLKVDRAHDAEPNAFDETLHEVPIEGFRLEETALVHQPTGTAIVADLVQNIGRPSHTWSKLYSRAMGFYDQLALSRVLRWTALSDRAAVRCSLDALLEQPFDRLIVGHGTPLESDGKARLAAAFDWL